MKAYIFQEYGNDQFMPTYTNHKFVSSRADALKRLKSRAQELKSLCEDDHEGLWRLKIVRVDIHPGKQNMLALLNDHETVVSVLKLGEVQHYSEGTYECEALVEIEG